MTTERTGGGPPTLSLPARGREALLLRWQARELPPPLRGRRGGGAPRLILALAIIAAAWLATLAAVQRLTDAAPAAFVILPPAGLLDTIPDAAVLSRTAFTITVTSDVPGLTAALYDAGALLVLPAGLTGCAGRPA